MERRRRSQHIDAPARGVGRTTLTRQWHRRAPAASVTKLAVLIVTLGTLSTATAQIISDPTGNVQIGTEASDNPNGLVAVANGGCATGFVAVGTGACAPRGAVAVGLGGSGAYGDIAVATSGNAENWDCVLVCVPPHVAVTGGNGNAGCGGGWTMAAVNLGGGGACGGAFAFGNDGWVSAATLAVSNRGNASSGAAAVSLMGTAGHNNAEYNDGSTPCTSGGVSVSVTGDACTQSGVALAPNGDAYSSGSGAAVGTAPVKRAATTAPEGAAGTDTYIHTGLNLVEDAYQAALVSTAPPVDPTDIAQKRAWATDVAPCVAAALATRISEPLPDDPSSLPPAEGQPCLLDEGDGLRESSAMSSTASSSQWRGAVVWGIVINPAYGRDGCVPQVSKAVYYTNSMPSQKRLYDEMGTRRAGGTTLATAEKVIRKYFYGRSKPTQSYAEDAREVMTRIVGIAHNAHQGTIVALDAWKSHWRTGSVVNKSKTTNHAVGTWGYYLGDGGYVFVVDGYDRPDWGIDNPYGYNNWVKLTDLWKGMKALTGGNRGDMIW